MANAALHPWHVATTWWVHGRYMRLCRWIRRGVVSGVGMRLGKEGVWKEERKKDACTPCSDGVADNQPDAQGLEGRKRKKKKIP